ncbi:hypothetical protein D3C76_610890 [compost metagenome]
MAILLELFDRAAQKRCPSVAAVKKRSVCEVASNRRSTAPGAPYKLSQGHQHVHDGVEPNRLWLAVEVGRCEPYSIEYAVRHGALLQQGKSGAGRGQNTFADAIAKVRKIVCRLVRGGQRPHTDDHTT